MFTIVLFTYNPQFSFQIESGKQLSKWMSKIQRFIFLWLSFIITMFDMLFYRTIQILFSLR